MASVLTPEDYERINMQRQNTAAMRETLNKFQPSALDKANSYGKAAPNVPPVQTAQPVQSGGMQRPNNQSAQMDALKRANMATTNTAATPSVEIPAGKNMGKANVLAKLKTTASGARGMVNSPVAKGAGALAAIPAIMEAGNEDSTAKYAQRFAMNEPTGDGSVSDMAKFALLRTLGFASDLGDSMTFGAAGNLYRDKQMQKLAETAKLTTQPAPTANPPATDTEEAPAEEQVADGGYLPSTQIVPQDVPAQEEAQSLPVSTEPVTPAKSRGENIQAQDIGSDSRDESISLLRDTLEAALSKQNPLDAQTNFKLPRNANIFQALMGLNVANGAMQRTAAENKMIDSDVNALGKAGDDMRAIAAQEDAEKARQFSQGLSLANLDLNEAQLALSEANSASSRGIAGENLKIAQKNQSESEATSKQNREKGAFELDKLQSLRDTLAAYQQETDPAKREQLAQRALLLQGKEPKDQFEFKVVDATNEQGFPIKQLVRVNSKTGESTILNGQGGGSAGNQPAGFKEGQMYNTPQGVMKFAGYDEQGNMLWDDGK